MAFLVTFVDRPGLPRTICMMFMRATASIGLHASSLFALFFRILERLPDGLSFENVHVKTLGKNLSRVFFNFQLWLNGDYKLKKIYYIFYYCI